MNTKLVLVGCAAVLVGVTASAEERLQGPYAGADLGGAVTTDAKLKSFPGASGGHHVEFDPGVRLSLNGGWRFNSWFRAGGEFGIISHTIDGADAALTHMPMMANIEFQLPNRTRIVPFIGGGPGISISVFDIDDDNIADGDFIDGSESDAVFAWQVYGGVRFKINHAMSVGLVYKYFDADKTEFEVHHTSDIRFGRTQTHSISASFNMDF